MGHFERYFKGGMIFSTPIFRDQLDSSTIYGMSQADKNNTQDQCCGSVTF